MPVLVAMRISGECLACPSHIPLAYLSSSAWWLSVAISSFLYNIVSPNGTTRMSHLRPRWRSYGVLLSFPFGT